MKLRDYQSIRVEEAVRRLRTQHCAMVLATGTGKTITALETVRRMIEQRTAVGRGLWLCDVVPLVSQTQRAAAALGVPVEVRTIQGRRAIEPGEYDVLVLDECHKFLTELRMAKVLGARTPMLGLTATPRRGDGRHIREIFGDDPVCGPYTIGQAIDDGWLCDARVLRVELREMDLRKVRKTARDLNEGDLAKAVNIPPVTREVVRRWLEHSSLPDGTLMLSNFFCVDTAHADEIAAEVNRQVGSEVCKTIHSKVEDSAARIEAFRREDLRVVASVMMIAEGFDHPALQCGVLVRPTRSERLLVQMLGRFLRPHPSKDRALILDCQGAYERLDLTSIYDVLADVDEDAVRTALTEAELGGGGDGSGGDEDEETLADIVSRLREVRLFRDRCAEARTLPWVRVGERLVLPVDRRTWVVIGRHRDDPALCIAAHLYYQGRLAIWKRVADLVPEPDAIRLAERFVHEHWSVLGLPDAQAAKAVTRWFTDRERPSSRQVYMLGQFGHPYPVRQRGEAQHYLRRYYGGASPGEFVHAADR